MNAGLSRLLLAPTLSAPLVGPRRRGRDLLLRAERRRPRHRAGPPSRCHHPRRPGHLVHQIDGPEWGQEPFTETFDKLIASLTFPAKPGEPSMKWTLPAGWTDSLAPAKSPMMDRVATLTPAGKDKPEITITKLPATASVIKPNVDRWRPQRPGTHPDFAAGDGEGRPRTRGSRPQGYGRRYAGPGGQGMAASPMAGHPPMGGRPAGRDRRPQGKSPLKYKAPEGWREVRTPPGSPSPRCIFPRAARPHASSSRPLQDMPGGMSRIWTAGVRRWACSP